MPFSGRSLLAETHRLFDLFLHRIVNSHSNSSKTGKARQADKHPVSVRVSSYVRKRDLHKLN